MWFGGGGWGVRGLVPAWLLKLLQTALIFMMMCYIHIVIEPLYIFRFCKRHIFKVHYSLCLLNLQFLWTTNCMNFDLQPIFGLEVF